MIFKTVRCGWKGGYKYKIQTDKDIRDFHTRKFMDVLEIITESNPRYLVSKNKETQQTEQFK